jgi:hypothetical protein
MTTRINGSAGNTFPSGSVPESTPRAPQGTPQARLPSGSPESRSSATGTTAPRQTLPNRLYDYQAADPKRIDNGALLRRFGAEALKHEEHRSLPSNSLEFAVPPGPHTPFSVAMQAARDATGAATAAGTSPPDPALVKHADNFTSKDAKIGDRMKAWKALCQAADANPASLPQPFGALVAQGMEAMAGTKQSQSFQKALQRATFGKEALSSLAAHAHEAMKAVGGDTELGKTLSHLVGKEVVGPNSDPLMRRELLTHAADAYHELRGSNPELAASWNGTAMTALHRSLRYDGVTVGMLAGDEHSTQYLETLKNKLP